MKPSLGIDLGTSNSATALVAPGAESAEILPVTQALGPHSMGEKSGLASALYIPNAGEFSDGAFRLPWQSEDDSRITGEFAREHGAQVPDRLVTSAKSWLCNPHVNHREPILPWRSEIEAGKLSPFEASRSYLRHLCRNYEHAGHSIADTFAVLTVPASFDDAARSLTHEAARESGLGEVTLLEEPQAAFYAWLQTQGADWRQQVRPGDLVLVCDVGGGTSDFSLIVISETEGNLELERISVGEHILLGGDNIDLALGYALRAQLEGEYTDIDDWQFLALVHGARQAKEQLFDNPDLTEASVAIPSRGSGLIAGSLSVTLQRKLLEQISLEGFLPMTAVTELPEKRQSAGLQEFGLPYATDAALSKHLADFLTRSLRNVESNETLLALVPEAARNAGFIRPSAVLFNGGFFKAAPARSRLLEVLKSWIGDSEIRELAGAKYDLAVAEGAAFYGRLKQGDTGLRIKAGAARSYYIGLETTMLAVPGFRPPVKALCVVPQGMEEGSEAVLESKEFGLVTGEEVEFRFFASAERAGDTVGAVLPNAETTLEESAKLKTVLTPLEGMSAGETVPVKLHAKVTELGTLELWMQHTRSEHTWKLEFSVRTE